MEVLTVDISAHVKTDFTWTFFIVLKIGGRRDVKGSKKYQHEVYFLWPPPTLKTMKKFHVKPFFTSAQKPTVKLWIWTSSPWGAISAPFGSFPNAKSNTWMGVKGTYKKSHFGGFWMAQILPLGDDTKTTLLACNRFTSKKIRVQAIH